MKLPASKDFWSGVMFMAFAGVAVLEARGYSMGTAGRMGPGYFPTALGLVLGGLGLVLIARSAVVAGERVEGIAVVPLAILAAAVVLFALLIEPFGLVVSLGLVTVLSAIASRQSRPLEVGMLTVVMCALAVTLFVWTLKLQLPVWPSL